MKKSILKSIKMSMFTLAIMLLTIITVNADATTNLTINNIQTDNKANSYSYKIYVEGLSGAVRYSIDGKEGYAVFDAKGNATITVNSNSTITLYEVPINKNYTVEQATQKTGYKVLVNNEETTKANGATSPTTSVSFTNKSIDESTPAKEQKEEKNPVTADPIVIAVVALVIAVAGFIALKNLKVRRYE